MTVSTVAASSSRTLRRFGIPALFTSTSTPPRACERVGGQLVDGGGIAEVGDQLVDRRAVCATALGGGRRADRCPGR